MSWHVELPWFCQEHSMLWLQHERLSSLLTLSGPSERHGQCKSLEAPLVSTVHQKKETAQVWVLWVVFKREISTWVSIGCQANHAISPWDILRWILTFRQLLQLNPGTKNMPQISYIKWHQKWERFSHLQLWIQKPIKSHELCHMRAKSSNWALLNCDQHLVVLG